MLEEIFLQILNMSILASIAIVFVLFARLFLKKVPNVFSYVLWAVVLFRLICPVSFESFFSLLPTNPNPIPQNIGYMQTPKINTGILVMNSAVNDLLPAAAPSDSVNPLQIWISVGSMVWLFGAIFLLAYGIFSLLKLKKRLETATHYKNNVFISENIDTAFVLGIFRPNIYLPNNLADTEKNYILLHEQTHIKRLDHIIKSISYLALCIHWFNPIVWTAFFISSKDMEMSCDDAVINQLGNSVKKDYSSSLLTLATGKRIVGGTPLAFGEGDTKDRIKNVLHYKKPAFWAVIVAVAAVTAIGAGLLSNPNNTILLIQTDSFNAVQSIDKLQYGQIVVDEKVLDIANAKIPEFNKFIKQLKVRKEPLSSSLDVTLDHSNRIYLVSNENTDFEEIKKLNLNFSRDFKEVWIDNDFNNTFIYAVKYPLKVKLFFEQQSAALDSAKYLWAAKTNYIGDNSAVGNLIGLLPLPQEVIYDHFELHTTEQPYTIDIVYSADKDTLDKYNEGKLSGITQMNKNALLLLALVDNAACIRTVITDGTRETEIVKSREWAEDIMNADVRRYADSPEKLQELINFNITEVSDNKKMAEYTIMKVSGNGEQLTDYILENNALAEAIIMNVIVKSAAWKGVDISTLEECYLIRQSFPESQEIHDYYAYQRNDGTAVLQSGTNGMYSMLSNELYSQLIQSFDSAQN